MKTYISYRPTYLNQGAGRYTISYFLNQQYKDYVDAGITKIYDFIIPDARYTKEIIPGIKSERRFAILEANGIDINEFKDNVMKIGVAFDINDLSNIEDARAFIREYTNLVEEKPGYFILSEETIGINGEIIPKQYLIID